MTSELIAVFFFIGILVLVGLVWRFNVPRSGLRDVQVVFEEGEWAVYGISHTGDRMLIDAFHQQTDALACAYKVARQQREIRGDAERPEDQE